MSTTNPYQSPTAHLADQVEPVGSNYGLLALAASLPASVAAVALAVVPSFTAVYAGFGAKLSLGTLVLLATYRWWGVVALAITVAWLIGGQTRLKQRVLLVVGLVSALALFAFGLFALYQPMFDLAAQT